MPGTVREIRSRVSNTTTTDVLEGKVGSACKVEPPASGSCIYGIPPRGLSGLNPKLNCIWISAKAEGGIGRDANIVTARSVETPRLANYAIDLRSSIERPVAVAY